jgi:YHS domain-containing protein/thiol-disulfide isomerase/thioredoxin
MRLHRSIASVVLGLLLTASVTAQEAVHWHNDLESAKTMARTSGRLVLIHFWTPSCGPCMALNQNVFSQPGVASALEAQFVPVKLNADENSATASSFNITRVPTDVIITPDGHVVAKLISPPTPAAYVAELTAAAGKYTGRSGGAFAKAAEHAPVQSQINSAYANLQVSPSAMPAMDPIQTQTAAVGGVAGASVPFGNNPLGLGKQQPGAPPMGYSGLATGTSPVPTPQVAAYPGAAPRSPLANPYLSATSPATQPPAPPINVPALPPAAPPTQFANPYMSAGAPGATTPIQPALPKSPPMITSPSAYDNSSLRANAPTSPIVPSAAAQAATSAAPATAGVPDVSKLPPGSPPLAFEGYCPVTMRNQWKWVAGDFRYGVVHRGHTYWFAGPEEQKQFWADPDRYTPALSGMDPVFALDHQQQVPGKREHSLDYDGMFYMFASEATLQQFTANPQRYASNVRQAMGIPRGRLVR